MLKYPEIKHIKDARCLTKVGIPDRFVHQFKRAQSKRSKVSLRLSGGVKTVLPNANHVGEVNIHLEPRQKLPRLHIYPYIWIRICAWNYTMVLMSSKPKCIWG